MSLREAKDQIKRKVIVGYNWFDRRAEFLERVNGFELLVIFIFTLIGSLYLFFSALIPYNIWSSYDYQMSTTVEFLLAGATFLMVVMIYAQVKKESEYLENFEPSIEVVKAKEQQITEDNLKYQNEIEVQYEILNPSQTSAVVDSVEIKELSSTTPSISGYKTDNQPSWGNTSGSDFGRTIPVEPNKLVHVKILLDKRFDLTEDEIQKIIKQGYITVVLEGNFGKTERKILLNE